jgi:hypothetical protein
MILEVREEDIQAGPLASKKGLDGGIVIFAPPPGVNEVEDHLRGGGDQIVEPVHEPGERSYPDDAGRSWRDGGHGNEL